MIERMRSPGRGNTAVRPRIGFLGVGWIGRNRLEALVNSGLIEAAAIAEPSRETALSALTLAPEAVLYESYDVLLEQGLDGIVIATPSALHAEQSIRALESGHAVFCQKPLGRNSSETLEVMQTARRTDRLLGVDLSYRYLRGMQKIRNAIHAGILGEIYVVNVTFHNAYGPDKTWFYDPCQSGGGCVLDLGIHLIDLALWTLGYPGVENVTGRLFRNGKPLSDVLSETEDYAAVRIDLSTGACINLAASWNLPAGQDAVIEASFYGTAGGAALRNLNGSFYEFTAERFTGTRKEVLDVPPDDWGKGAVVAWAEQLARSPRFDPDIFHLQDVAEVIDRIYGK